MKKAILSGIAAAGSALWLGMRHRQPRPRPAKSAELAHIERAAHRSMMSVIVPTWIAAGLLDYIWHRRTRIQTTSGPRESLLHLFMLAEGAPVVLAPLVLEVNAGILALMIAAYLAHQATAMWDINTTVRERLIPANEQHIHAYLEGVPFAIVALYSTIHWQQFLALLGLGSEKPRFEVRLKQPVLPLREVVLLSAAVGGLDVLPHVEEYWRCLKAQQRGEAGTETPACAPVLFA
jgi:hypothetical protein